MYESKVCAICEEEFTPNSGRQLYCEACRDEARKERLWRFNDKRRKTKRRAGKPYHPQESFYNGSQDDASFFEDEASRRARRAADPEGFKRELENKACKTK